ncbi:MAG: hypothetical protein NVSMB27_21180 [Ktedonobacteraceae bacterium]
MDTPENIPASPRISEITTQGPTDSSSTSTKKQADRPLPLRIVIWFYHWFQENTFAPGFLTGVWSHPIFGYLAALLFQLVMVIALLALIYIYPSFRFPEGPLVLVILIVTLGWGAGPGIFAMLIGTGLLLYFVIPPFVSLSRSGDIIAICVYVAVGLTSSILASNTERGRRTSEQLRLRLDTIIEAIPDPLVLYDLQGRSIQQNRVMREHDPAEYPALTLEEIASKFAFRNAKGEPLPLEAMPLTRALHGETVIQAELVYRLPVLEQDRFVVVSAAPFYAPSGKAIEGAVTITHDLTERKRAEEQEHFLAEVSKVLSSTLDYQETLSNIAHLVVPQLADWFAVDLVDAEGHFEQLVVDHKDPEQVKWARELREKYPVDPDAPTGAPHVVRTGQSELYPEITDEMLVASSRSEEGLTIARQLGLTSLMNVPLVARGRTIGVVSFVSTESGKRYDERDLALAEEVGRRAGVALDNARLFQEVKQTRDQLDIILQGVADGIIVYDTSDQVIYTNEAAAQLTGHASVQALMKTATTDLLDRYELIDEQGLPFPHSHIPHRRVFAGERDAQATIGYRDTNSGQTERWSLVRSRPVFDEHERVLYAISIIHDITESHEEKRRKDEFISMASHELKTPVTSLKGFTNILQRRLGKQGDEQGLYFLARMDAQLNKLTKLISDLLDVSKMQAGKLPLDLEPFDLDALIQETVENVQATTTTHRFLIEGRTDGCVQGDRDRLGQVFINLLTNAVKYSPRADKVLVHLSGEQEQVIVSVQDFGIGIDPSQHKKIFERFYQVTDPEERTYPGLGMGLYISSEIVERHHGRLWLESRKGEGSTFSVALPLLQQE